MLGLFALLVGPLCRYVGGLGPSSKKRVRFRVQGFRVQVLMISSGLRVQG